MAVNRYNRPLVNSAGGINRWDDPLDPNASQSQQANKNAQGGWGGDDDDGWVARPPTGATSAPSAASAGGWSNFTLGG